MLEEAFRAGQRLSIEHVNHYVTDGKVIVASLVADVGRLEVSSPLNEGLMSGRAPRLKLARGSFRR